MTLNWSELILTSLLAMSRLAAIVLFGRMLLKPEAFTTRMKVAIAIFAFLVFLPFRRIFQ